MAISGIWFSVEEKSAVAIKGKLRVSVRMHKSNMVGGLDCTRSFRNRFRYETVC
jgi:hypothetical protein